MRIPRIQDVKNKALRHADLQPPAANPQATMPGLPRIFGYMADASFGRGLALGPK
jgi:hypothetical protein